MTETTDYEDYYPSYSSTNDSSQLHFDFKIPLLELIPITLAYSLTFVIGLVGNILVIFCVTKFRKMRSLTNIFLTSLATADLLIICICVPIKLIAFLSYTWTMGKFLCKFVHYMQNVSVICSVLTLTTMSVERYLAIIYPLKVKIFSTLYQAKMLITSVWVISFILATPILVGRQHIEVGEVRKGYWCIKEWPNREYSIAYEIFQLCLLLLFPVIIMSFAYVSIARELKNVRKQRHSFQNLHVDQRNERPLNTNQLNKNSNFDEKFIHKQITKMLIVVIGLYVMCWSPILINNLLAALHIIPQLHMGIWKNIRPFLFLLSYVNSCLNPVVYAFISKSFRHSFKMAVITCFKGRRKAYLLQQRQNQANCYYTNNYATTNFAKNSICRWNNNSTKTKFVANTVNKSRNNHNFKEIYYDEETYNLGSLVNGNIEGEEVASINDNYILLENYNGFKKT